MITALITHKVRDFDYWLKGFEDNASARELAGCTNAKVFTEPDNRSNVVCELQWKSLESFNRFLESDDLRVVMEQAGVIGEPEVKILNEVQYSKL